MPTYNGMHALQAASRGSPGKRAYEVEHRFGIVRANWTDVAPDRRRDSSSVAVVTRFSVGRVC
ncbi:MAG: hypothetical protein JO352_38315 [Chloroflexi bacterium]|nr:hypothetical protein [Chloroflexota bacterium]MBV9595880.1 hypothetical protein [Chloroflexota bacterium]